MKYKALPNEEKWILKGIPLLFIIGSLMHFLYNIFWESIAVGLFAPVNESVWEHSKMVLLPIILWWSLYYCFKGKKYNISKNKWFQGGLVSLLTSLTAIPLLFYFYTEAFGVELLWVDISILLISIILGQLLGLHFYKYWKGINYIFVIAILVLIILIFVVFTFYPPHIPMFYDTSTGSYGIT